MRWKIYKSEEGFQVTPTKTFNDANLDELGLEVGESFMYPVTKEYTEEELTYYWDSTNYQEFLEEIKEYED